jgi:hypothetical protein
VVALEHADGAWFGQLHQAVTIRGHQHHLGKVEVQAIDWPLLFRSVASAFWRSSRVVQVSDEFSAATCSECAADSGRPRNSLPSSVLYVHVAARAEHAGASLPAEGVRVRWSSGSPLVAGAA